MHMRKSVRGLLKNLKGDIFFFQSFIPFFKSKQYFFYIGSHESVIAIQVNGMESGANGRG